MSETFDKDILMGALKTAVQHFNTLQDPNQAVVKAAQEHDFNTEQTTRLVETFNTARTIFHFKHAADRSTEFPLAKSAVVIPAMFSEEDCSPAEKAAVGQDYSAYEIPEADYQSGLMIDKAAGVQMVDIPEPRTIVSNVDAELGHQCHRAQSALMTQRQISKAASDEARVAANYASQTLTKLAQALATGYEDICQDQYNRFCRVLMADTTLSPVYTKLAEFVPQWLETGFQNEKWADAVVEDRDLSAYMGLAKTAREYMDAEVEMLAMSSVLQKEASDFEREFTEMVVPNAPVEKEAQLSDFVDWRLVKEAQSLLMVLPASSSKEKPVKEKPVKEKPVKEKPGYGMFPAVGEAAAEGAKKPISSFVETGLDKMLHGPTERANTSMSQRLQNVQRQIMLEELMTTDPILAEEEPETVTRAYQQIVSMAPQVSMQPEVVRSLLRAMSHSVGVDTFDATSWTKLEQSLRGLTGADTPAAPVKPAKGRV
jgi:hypothetical protein